MMFGRCQSGIGCPPKQKQNGRQADKPAQRRQQEISRPPALAFNDQPEQGRHEDSRERKACCGQRQRHAAIVMEPAGDRARVGNRGGPHPDQAGDEHHDAKKGGHKRHDGNGQEQEREHSHAQRVDGADAISVHRPANRRRCQRTDPDQRLKLRKLPQRPAGFFLERRNEDAEDIIKQVDSGRRCQRCACHHRPTAPPFVHPQLPLGQIAQNRAETRLTLTSTVPIPSSREVTWSLTHES